MLLTDPDVREYIAAQLGERPGQITMHALGGGVSNLVMRIDGTGRRFGG